MTPPLRLALRAGASLALVAVVFALTDGATDHLREARPGWLLAAALALTAQTVLMALRWRLTAARLGLPLGKAQAVGEYYLAQIVNTTLPGGVLGDAARAVRTRDGTGLTRAAHAVMIERLAGQVAMAALLAAGLATALILPGGIDWPLWPLAALLALTATFALATTALRRLPPVRTFLRATRHALLARAVWPQQAALGLAIATLNLAAFAACARATGTALPPEAVLTLVPLILTAMVIPLSVAGWGWREGAAAALFPLAGATPGAGVAAGVAFGLVMLAASLPGALWPLLAPDPDDRPAEPLTKPAHN